MKQAILILIKLTKSFPLPSLCQTDGKTKSEEKIIDELNKLLELKSQKGIELHVKDVRKRSNQIKRGGNEHKLTDFDSQKIEILENDIKGADYIIQTLIDID